ncbi:MAG TPA: rhomboid family intramembrane serine protease, partial [Flavobacteriales bacterium]|nr:rhomboid family intramembrane serine protease [Flavobacteriales bacterium]
YSLAFFLLTGSIIRKNRQLTGVLFLIIFLYGSIFWGLLPLVPGVSWESHVYGALTGVVLGIVYRKTMPDQVLVVPPIVDDPADDDPNAWWKTGVIEERKEPTIQYHYTPKEDTDDKRQK